MTSKKKSLFEVWDQLREESVERFLFLFLDFDGTLTPIAPAPDQAVLAPATRQLLRRLAARRDLRLAIVSGRALKDVRDKVGIKNIIYVGNHGFEIRGPGLRFERANAVHRTVLQEIKKKLARELKGIPGTVLEDKGATLSLHYRGVAAQRRGIVLRMCRRVCHPYLEKQQVKVSHGKKVFEVKPPVDWNKGKAVQWILQQKKFLGQRRHPKFWPIYIGDDKTDEDAFCVLQNRGVTVVVGKRSRSCAQYHLKNPAEVSLFLQSLVKENSLKHRLAG